MGVVLRFDARDADGNEFEVVMTRDTVNIRTRGGTYSQPGRGQLRLAETGQSVNRKPIPGKLEIVARPKIELTTEDPRALRLLWPVES